MCDCENASEPCVAADGMPCECRELLCELRPYVHYCRPDLRQRIEALLRRDIAESHRPGCRCEKCLDRFVEFVRRDVETTG